MVDAKGSCSTDVDALALHKQWDEVSCPICMDHPHNAVLLLCTSHDKGCRCYVCDTSYRHSNCLDRFKKSRANPESAHGHPGTIFEGQGVRSNRSEGDEVSRLEGNGSMFHAALTETSRGNDHRGLPGMMALEENGVLKCPLCRGDVLGWKVAQDARQYLDQKPRSCSCESCSFSGNYGELRRHARRVHPSSRPADVDPTRRQAWHQMEHRREHGDIRSAIRSAMPGALVLGDYVIDSGDDIAEFGIEGEPWWATLFLLQMFSSHQASRSSRAWRRRHHRSSRHRNLWGENLVRLQDDDGYSNGDRSNRSSVPRRRRRLSRSRFEERP